MKVSYPSQDDLGDSKWPPGFRFHPTDEELVLYYLKKKICRRRLRLNVIGELDVYKWDPEELPGQSLLKSGDRQWFFFCHRDRRYPNGGRVNRATRHGYWKATGKDRNVICNNRTVGVKKTLVFYKGRAPSGERTDWVMHEYTVDEEELKRCQTAQESFALYKVFKKSGPGPKNGEQYGATFREEEWADDNDPVDTVQPINVIPPSVDSLPVYDQGLLPENDIEEIFGQIVDDPKIDQPQIDEFTHVLHQVGSEEEALSTMVDPSFGEAISTIPRVVLHPGGQQSVAQTSFEVTLSAISNMYSCDAPEVTSAPTISEWEPHAVENDFIEMNDLLGPPSFPEMGNAYEDLQLQEASEWDGPELYFDAAMFLRDLGPIDQGMVPESYFDTMTSQLNYQLSSQTVDTNNVSSELWAHEQRSSIFASPGPDQVVLAPPNSGFVYAGSSSNHLVEARQNQGGNNGESQDSWISSKVWGFLDSIPTTPASASESALINLAFERMSSFGRVRINPSSMDVAATPVVRRTGGSRGFGFLSFLGVMRAVLWVLILSVAVKVFSTFLGKFVLS
ncbi:hypothetical protein NE237_017657 [Protea cynaroides]|uniref:NAC domain-containing protein n=1 Tax=Protea cynaroides TaxID=273540 RepID=A0A9Q0K8G3_9MAGN|nr:hypothetical protein NE237_017657 [Protea cynaroides]